MTFDQCQEALTAIRRRQGTRYPTIRVDYGGAAYRGRLCRSDSDPEHRPRVKPPDGYLVLEDPREGRRPEILLRIATLEPGSIRDPLDV